MVEQSRPLSGPAPEDRRVDPAQGGAAVALDPALLAVLESAARLQQLVPDAVLVGRSAAAAYAGHRMSFDHDHVLTDLRDRFDVVLEALESEGEWVTNRVRPGTIILGRIGDIEAGVRQLIRRTPLEVTELELPSGATLRVPTPDETLRIKAFLVVRRNQVRDYLDVVALADRYGLPHAASVLRRMDDFYADQHGDGDGVASQVVRQLADPRPADTSTTRELHRYKSLDPRWHRWADVARASRALAGAILEGES